MADSGTRAVSFGAVEVAEEDNGTESPHENPVGLGV